MKKIFIIAGALFFCSFLNAKNLEYNLVTDEFNGDFEYSVRITGTFDGIEVDVEITIHDVTWVGCKLLQAGIRAIQA